MNYENITLIIGVAVMIATLVGLSAFLWSYRPFSPRKHGRAGAHLIYTFWSLWALYFVSLFQLVVPIPLFFGLALQDIVLVAIMLVVWQRVHLLRSFRRGELDQREKTDGIIMPSSIDSLPPKHEETR